MQTVRASWGSFIELIRCQPGRFYITVFLSLHRFEGDALKLAACRSSARRTNLDVIGQSGSACDSSAVEQQAKLETVPGSCPEISFWSITLLARPFCWHMSHKPVSGQRDR